MTETDFKLLMTGKWLLTKALKKIITLLLFLTSLLVPAARSYLFAKPTPLTAQLVGTLMDGRSMWNPFDPRNDMEYESNGNFKKTLLLSATGGRNHDGIYSMRFLTGKDLRSVFKRGLEPGKLVSGPGSVFGGNVIFKVPLDGTYVITFNPNASTYLVTPHIDELLQIQSFQLNGFVHDKEGNTECFDGRLTRPAEKWDEWVPSHEFTNNRDGSWTISLLLSAKGGHENNGVYQCLFSANHNADWGYSAILDKPGRLAGGNGYDSRVGNILETAIVFRVSADARYTFTVWPESYRFSISPTVDFYHNPEYQVNGDVVNDPWNPSAPGHQMIKGKNGVWQKSLNLKNTGGSIGTGVYTMNFSINADWALDSIGFGGLWGKTWHSAPQESNILFRVEKDGEYMVTLDPTKGSFAIDPPVTPITRIESLQIAGNFEAFAKDGKEGWNPIDPMHDMGTSNGHLFTRDIMLTGGVVYHYKYTANHAGWSWSLVDYPYDGYRRLALHGNPPPLSFNCPRNGIYRFSADTQSGEYSVVLVHHK